jgi:SNF2 family DNA or RNA helicase
VTNKYLEKLAKQAQTQKETPLQPHQVRALKKLEDEGGIVVNHSTGSGKTRLMIEAIRRAQEKDKNARVFMTAPASLLHNVDKEIKKHGVPIDKKRLDLYSFQKATRDADQIRKNKYALAVVDEAHGLRNEGTKRTQELRDIIEGSDQRLLATATSNYNAISDMSTLVNIAAGDKVLPESKRDMYDKYVETYKKPRGFISTILHHQADEGQRLKNKKRLRDVLDQYVDYYDTKDSVEGRKHFPKKTEETIETEMSPEQLKYYKYVEGDLPLLLKFKIRHNLPLDKKEKASLNSFSTGVRQVSNSYRHLHQHGEDLLYTPKIEAATKKLQEALKSNPRHKALVYSNYLNAGLDEYSNKLTKLGIKHGKYTGELSKEEKHKLVEDYNKGKLPVMLISSSGSEGLDTKGTRQIQILEPHFNKSKIKQVIGRGVRFNSHEHLPEKEREVHIEHYLSTYPKSHFGKTPYSIDKYLNENAEDKDELFNEVNGLMKENNE